MAKSLACMIGRHRWTTRVEEAETYEVCAACGATSRDSRGSKSLPSLRHPGSDVPRPQGEDPRKEFE
jgi:hypothetical protein